MVVPVDRVVSVELSGWEIECCVPPPAVGDAVSWPLVFTALAEGEVDPDGFDRPAATSGWWRVERRDDGATVLVDGAVTAAWYEYRSPPPTPGVRELRGTLHGGPPEPPEPTVGVVRRLWVTSQVYVERPERGPRYWGPVPGTLEVREVTRSPRWFASGGADATGTEPTGERHELGLLVELGLAAPTGG